jgi:hypothetical protein
VATPLKEATPECGCGQTWITWGAVTSSGRIRIRRLAWPQQSTGRAGIAKTSIFEAVQPSIANKAFDFVSGLVKDRFSSKAQAPHELAVTPATQVDVADQLHKLGSLGDAGILTDEEFATKKAELQSCWHGFENSLEATRCPPRPATSHQSGAL